MVIKNEIPKERKKQQLDNLTHTKKKKRSHSIRTFLSEVLHLVCIVMSHRMSNLMLNKIEFGKLVHGVSMISECIYVCLFIFFLF